MKINTSITDFAPLFLDIEYLFKGLKETGVDGVELVIGVKSRWSVDKIKRLSKKYDLPIVSLHQPVWSGLGMYFDENFFDLATQLGAHTVTCHPLPKFSLTDEGMHEYAQRLSRIQREKGITILLENMSETYGMKIVDTFFPLHKETTEVVQLANFTKKYGLHMTLDIDHLHKPQPEKEPWFAEVFPQIKNIHLSSFTDTTEHQPLFVGDFKAKEFLNYLKEHNYPGLLTFEINFPKFINIFTYDFTAIKKSVEFLQESL